MLIPALALSPNLSASARRVDADLRERVPALRTPVVWTWEAHHRLIVDSRGNPWVFGPLDIDPYRNRNGGYPLPTEVRQELEAISAAGAAFHQIAIAHEVDPKGPVARRLAEDLPPAGLAIAPKEAGEFVGRAPATGDVIESARKIEDRLRKAGRAARRIGEGATIAAVAVAAAPLAMRDPIVFGVLGLDGLPNPGRPALHYPLAAWLWAPGRMELLRP